jgi:uncharacterized protein
MFMPHMHKCRRGISLIVFLGFMLALTACSQTAWSQPTRIPLLAETGDSDVTLQAEVVEPAQVAPQVSVTRAPTETPPPPTPTEVPPTATPTATPTLPPHPMSIDVLRQAEFPGSAIEIDYVIDPQVFAPSGRYTRYYASYLSEGYRIYGMLTIPDGDMPPGGWPAIVFNHGYIPPDVYRTTERYVNYVNSLANSGYIVFRIDYRGHDRSEGQPTGAYSHPGYTVDVLNAVAAIKQYPLVNPDRIGMWGHSMGGFLTLRAMVISPDVRVGVIWGGVVASYPDLLTTWRRSDGPTPTPSSVARGWRGEWINRYGTPEENPAFWASVSANSYLPEISGPIQLHHGTADDSVPLVFSEMLYQQMLAAGQPVEMHAYAGDNHNISNSFNTAMARTIQFFDAYLK